MNELVVQSEVGSRIYTIRGLQVMLDRDLAMLYEVEAKRLNEQVKRNKERFPSDFMFQLSEEEYSILKSQFVTLKNESNLGSQNATSSSKHGGRRYLPYVFTEQGVYMLATVLKSGVATEVSISIMRTFTKLREFSLHYNALAKKIIELERKNDKQFKEVFEILDSLVEETKKTDEKVMGFIKR